jgi:hypothetical protein
MIDISDLSDLQKHSKKDIEINKPISYGIIAVSIGHDPMKQLRSLFHQLKGTSFYESSPLFHG